MYHLHECMCTDCKEIKNLKQKKKEYCILKTFCDPVTYLCNQLERIKQLWKMTAPVSFLWSLVKIQLVVLEEKLFKEIVDERTDGRTYGRTMDDGQWAITKAHLEHCVLRWAKMFTPPTFIMLFRGNFAYPFWIMFALQKIHWNLYVLVWAS